MNKILQKKLEKLNFIIVSHIFATGPALDLEEYLSTKCKNLLFIGHPFSFKKEVSSFYRSYKNRRLVDEHSAIEWKFPDPVMYFKDALYTFLWILLSKEKFNYYIGSDNFDAYLGLLLKKLGKVEQVVLYTIDYLPNRFKNPVLNYLYHYFDKQCLKHCKIVWNVSPVVAKAREKYRNLKQKEMVEQIIVPLGIWHQRISKLSLDKKEHYQLVFMGHILEKQGLQLVLEAMPKIISKIPLIKLLIIGTGKFENKLKMMIKKLKIEKYVSLTGFIEDHKDVEKLLSGSTIALAMYKPDPNSFTNWADPGKIKNYLSAGLPVVLTSVPPIARQIQEKKCAIIADYDKEQFAKEVVEFLTNKKKLEEYRKNAIIFAEQFDWNKVFEKALMKSLD